MTRTVYVYTSDRSICISVNLQKSGIIKEGGGGGVGMVTRGNREKERKSQRRGWMLHSRGKSGAAVSVAQGKGTRRMMRSAASSGRVDRLRVAGRTGVYAYYGETLEGAVSALTPGIRVRAPRVRRSVSVQTELHAHTPASHSRTRRF